MAQIGSTGCTFVKGMAPTPKQRVITWQVPGIDGYGAQLLGYGDGDFEFHAIAYGTALEILLWSQAIERHQGQIVSIIDDFGTVYTLCLITRVTPLKRTAALVPGTIVTTRGEMHVSGVVV
jgi:hypothetical protein